MKTGKVNYLLYLCFLLSPVCIEAQPKPCGNPRIDTVALQRIVQYESKNLESLRKPLAVTRVVRIYFHILRLGDGTQPAATEDNLNTEFQTLLNAYASDNICFANMGFNYIDNTILDTNFNADNNPFSLFEPYLVPNCINVFYVKKIKGTNNACAGGCGIGGVAAAIPGTFCLVSNGNIGNGQTVAHEVGHCMGLLHTFETFGKPEGFEKIDGSNSTTAGDLITDTQADPYAYIGKPCFSTMNNGCTYSGNCTDPNGANNFSPPYYNLMAYWWNGKGVTCYGALSLTAGQFTRVNSTLDDPGGVLKDCTSLSDFTVFVNVTLSSGFYMYSTINTLTFTGNVLLTGSLESSLSSKTILLEPGFRANPSTGKVTIKPLPCN